MMEEATVEEERPGIQRRLALIHSQVLLKLDLVIQRDVGKLQLTWEAKKKKEQQTKTNSMENRAPTPPFLASICLDNVCSPGPRPLLQPLPDPPPQSNNTLSPDRHNSHVPPSSIPSSSLTTTAPRPPSPSSSAPVVASTPVQPPPQLVPSSLPAQPPKRPREPDGDLPITCVVAGTVGRKKAKKKRKNKLRQEAEAGAGGAEGGAGNESSAATPGSLVRWGLPPRPPAPSARDPADLSLPGPPVPYNPPFLPPPPAPFPFAHYHHTAFYHPHHLQLQQQQQLPNSHFPLLQTNPPIFPPNNPPPFPPLPPFNPF